MKGEMRKEKGENGKRKSESVPIHFVPLPKLGGTRSEATEGVNSTHLSPLTSNRSLFTAL